MLNNWRNHKLVTIIFLLLFFGLIGGLANLKNPNETQEPQATPSASPSSNTKLYPVTSVVDGDTIKILIDGNTETLRLIGTDTPETVDPREPVQCFGKEASNKAREILTGKSVSLEADPTQNNRDQYGRLLRYVYLEDGQSFNKLMISEGYAHEYTYNNNPYKYQAEYRLAEKQAREASLGLWSPNTCSGDTKKAASSSGTPSPAATTSTPTPSTTSTTPSTSPTASPALNQMQTSEGVVKKSKSDICHAPGTTYYDRTTNYTPFDTVQACLDSGGRLPER